MNMGTSTSGEPPPPLPVAPPFDPESKDFLCCCTNCGCCCHVRKGVIILTIWELFFSFFVFAAFAALFVDEGGYQALEGTGRFSEEKRTILEVLGGLAIAAYLMWTAVLIVSIATCFGLYRDRPRMLLPHLVLQVNFYPQRPTYISAFAGCDHLAGPYWRLCSVGMDHGLGIRQQRVPAYRAYFDRNRGAPCGCVLGDLVFRGDSEMLSISDRKAKYGDQTQPRRASL